MEKVSKDVHEEIKVGFVREFFTAFNNKYSLSQFRKLKNEEFRARTEVLRREIKQALDELVRRVGR